MKTLAIILSIYIVLLAAIPCCVFDNCPDDKATSNQTSENTHESGDEDGCGTCSPFFNCSTCNVSFINTPAIVFNVMNFVTGNKPQSNYIFIVTGDCFTSIWQPPKLA